MNGPGRIPGKRRKEMKNFVEDRVTARSGKYGSLKWFGHSYRPADKGACMLGRSLALFDQSMGVLSNLIIYGDSQERGNAIRRIGIWVDNQPKRVRYMYSSICTDLPQVGKDAVMDESVSLDEVCYWYGWQSNAIADVSILRKVLSKVWGGDMSRMSDDLCVPGSRLSLMFTWKETMGSDVQYCLEGAFEELMQTPGGREAFLGPDYDSRDEVELDEDRAVLREAFREGWRKREDELLAVAPEFRKEIWKDEYRR